MTLLESAGATSGGPVAASVLELLGATPLLRIAAPLASGHPGFWAKLEGIGPAGMKGRAAVSMLSAARARGELADGATVVESTSGSLGLGLALACCALRHPLVLVADRELDHGTRALLRARGVRLEIVDRPHPVGGWQRARLERAARVRRATPGAWTPDQYSNPDNRHGYAAMAAEIRDQCARGGPPAPHTLVCSVGTGGHSSGLAAELVRAWPGLRVVGVDSPASAVFGPEPGTRLMRGLGSSIHPDNVDYGAFDEVHWVGPAESVQACRALARHDYVTGGWSTGAAALVAARLAREAGDDGVLTVFPDGPERYAHSVFDDAFCVRHGLLGPVADTPAEVERPPGRVRSGWTRCRTVVDPCRARHPNPGTGPCPVCAKEDR